MTMTCIFAEADVCNEEEVGKRTAEKANGLNYRTFGIVGSCTCGIFDAGGTGYTKNDDRAKTFVDERFKEGD